MASRCGFKSAAKRIPAVLPPLPSPMRTNFINRSPVTSTVCDSAQRSCFRHVLSITDISHRNLSFMCLLYRPLTAFNGADEASVLQAAKNGGLQMVNGAGAAQLVSQDEDAVRSFGEKVEDKSIAWRPKNYGNVTFGPRNYPYPISRWLGRRFQMKKHRILKRMRFRRYKLAAVANLPFAKMIRVGLLPELKSSKAKKADDVDSGLGSQLVNAAKSSTGGKQAGRRRRPKSKYQV